MAQLLSRTQALGLGVVLGSTLVPLPGLQQFRRGSIRGTTRGGVVLYRGTKYLTITVQRKLLAASKIAALGGETTAQAGIAAYVRLGRTQAAQRLSQAADVRARAAIKASFKAIFGRRGVIRGGARLGARLLGSKTVLLTGKLARTYLALPALALGLRESFQAAKQDEGDIHSRSAAFQASLLSLGFAKKEGVFKTQIESFLRETAASKVQAPQPLEVSATFLGANPYGAAL